MRKAYLIFLPLICLFLFAGCGRNEQEEAGEEVDVYFLNKEETRVTAGEYLLKAREQDGQIQELLDALSGTPENLSLKAPISGSVKLTAWRVEESQLILNFDERYRELPSTTEVLVRAALVRTLTQAEGIEYVSVQIRDENLVDALGNPVGIMSADMFIDNAGDEINAYEKAQLRLYFADESGTGLVEVIRPAVVYNTNISMEKLVVEQLIGGPKNDSIYPTVNPDTKILSVTVKDGICYVNLDETFLTQIYNVTSEVTIYSIVNSLVELPNVNKVQISIGGKTDVVYRENISLTTIFERNLELVGNAEGLNADE